MHRTTTGGHVRVELTATIRGGERRVRWDNGELTGDDEILRRLGTCGVPIDRSDLVSVLRGVEMVTAQHVDVVNLDIAGSAEGPNRPRTLFARPLR